MLRISIVIAIVAFLCITQAHVDYAVLPPLLTSNTIDDFMQQKQPVILAFVADWCKKCKEIEPLFVDVMSDLNGFRFGRIDAVQAVGQTARFDVVSVPTLFLVQGDRIWRYRGPLSKDALIYFASTSYTTQEPLTWWTSPLGPFGKSKAYCIEIGIEFMRNLDLKNRLGVDVPEWMGFFIIVFCIGTITFAFNVLSVHFGSVFK